MRRLNGLLDDCTKSLQMNTVFATCVSVDEDGHASYLCVLFLSHIINDLQHQLYLFFIIHLKFIIA